MKTKVRKDDDAMAVHHHFRLVYLLGRCLDIAHPEHRLARDELERRAGIPRVSKLDDRREVIQSGAELYCRILFVDADVVKTVHIPPPGNAQVNEQTFLSAG